MKENERGNEASVKNKAMKYLELLEQSLKEIGADKGTSSRIMRSMKRRVSNVENVIQFFELIKSLRQLNRPLKMELLKYLKFLIVNMSSEEIISGEQI